MAVGCAPVDEQQLGHGYVRRGEHIYFEGGVQSGVPSARIDKPSKRIVNGFKRALGKSITVCSAPDAATFKALSEEYTRDKNKVYYKWISPGVFLIVELPKADVATFKAINFTHAADKNSIWYLDEPIPNSDPATARLIDNRVIKDSKRVYISGAPQPHLDAKTFRHAGTGYFTDANGAYWGRKRIEGADSATFKVLGDSYVGVDKASVYLSGKPQPHLDRATCKLILHDPYGYQVISDKNGVYLNKLRFLHADPSDFKMVDSRTGIGGKYVFLVDTWHSTPVTIYREGGRLVAETVLYEKGTTKSLATIKAEVTGKKLQNRTLSAPPGETAAREVPKWQLEIFERKDLVKKMNEAAKHLK